jgi:hypothetical protein
MRLILDCCKYAKEEQRIAEGLGSMAEYYMLLKPPDKSIPTVEVKELTGGETPNE